MIPGRWFRTIMIVAVCVFSFAGCLSEDTGKTESDNAAQRPGPSVLVQSITPRDIVLTPTFVGHVEGLTSAEVRSQVNGILKKRLFQEGQSVRAGQVLFEIDPASYQAKVDQAASRVTSIRARLNNAKRDLDRVVPLAARKSISQRDRDQVQTEYESARAELAEAEAVLRSARIDLDLTKVKAPLAGLASMALHNEGTLITAGSPESLLTTVYVMDPVQVVFSVSDTQIRKIRGYMESGRAILHEPIPARLSIDADQEYAHQGTMVFGNPVISRETGCMISKAVFPNPDKKLLPGQVVRITLDFLTFKDAVAVPDYAVLQGRDGATVVVVGDGDIASFRPIEVLARVGRDVLVASGLEAGERVIIEGVNKIGPGMRVAPREAADAGRPVPSVSPKREG
jgi:membrane fusion protein (multidrug efflux system)